jgi:hypothetical protein
MSALALPPDLNPREKKKKGKKNQSQRSSFGKREGKIEVGEESTKENTEPG